MGYHESKNYIPKSHSGNHRGNGGSHAKEGCLDFAVVAVIGAVAIVGTVGYGFVELVKAVI